MFGFFEKKKVEVISHWYCLVPGFNTSAADFYQGIEQELDQRQVPGLDRERIDFAEGGALSAKRTYLRMSRERLVFDICAAPFGTAFFFSCRFAETPAVIRLWQLLMLAVALYLLTNVVVKKVGLWSGLTLIALGLALIIYLLRNVVATKMHNLDATLIKSPVFGAIYENWFRKDTYYRQDTRLMYCDTVNAVVKAKVEEATGTNGIKLIQFNERSPILDGLYIPMSTPLPQA